MWFDPLLSLLKFYFVPILFFGSDKDRELGEAHAEIKALRLSERAREKAVEEVSDFFYAFVFLSFSFLFLGKKFLPW